MSVRPNILICILSIDSWVLYGLVTLTAYTSFKIQNNYYWRNKMYHVPLVFYGLRQRASLRGRSASSFYLCPLDLHISWFILCPSFLADYLAKLRIKGLRTLRVKVTPPTHLQKWFICANCIALLLQVYKMSHLMRLCHVGDQRRLRRACASVQSHQSHRCSHTWSMEVDEGSDQKKIYM